MTEWRRASDWAQKFLGLEDWSINLWTTTRPKWVQRTDALGSMRSFVRDKAADIWVNLPECTAQNEHPLQALFHEYLHIAFADVGFDAGTEHSEFLLNRLDKAILVAYRKGIT